MTDEDIPADLSTLIRLGTIASVDLAAARCTVRLGDADGGGEAETPPLRWLCGRAGETRHWSPPSVGEEVLLLCPDGQIGNGVALTGLANATNPAAGNSLAEVMLFGDGAQIAYDPESHELSAILPAGGTAMVDAPGGLTIRGDVTVEGQVTATGDVTAGGISLMGHRHGGVQSGGNQTGGPV